MMPAINGVPTSQFPNCTTCKHLWTNKREFIGNSYCTFDGNHDFVPCPQYHSCTDHAKKEAEHVENE